MKISKYTFLFDCKNSEFYIYNTLSNALVELDKSSYEYLSNLKDSKEISQKELDPELYKVLVTKKFITENDQDDFLLYKSVITLQRSSKSMMHLTIAPTMDCCFKCNYCFEKYKKPGNMTEEIMDAIVNYLNSLESKPDIAVTWFGGEPLMAIDHIEKLYDKFVEHYKKPTKSDVVTTGFHITEKTIEIFKRIGVSQIQITLDGLKETHNAVKYTVGCDDAFTKVLDNAELVMSLAPEINVVFRVNITKLNADEYVPLYKQLVSRYNKYSNYGISPGIIMKRGACNIESANSQIFFSPKENAEFNLDLYHKHQIFTVFMKYPERFFQECAIRNVLSISFDPEGYAYKCWEVIGNKEYSIGKLNEAGQLTEINEKVLNRHLYGADPIDDPVCSKCKFLPICHGGCPIQRIENKFEDGNNCSCTYYKDYIAEFLKIHIARKKAQEALESKES